MQTIEFEDETKKGQPFVALVAIRRELHSPHIDLAAKVSAGTAQTALRAGVRKGNQVLRQYPDRTEFGVYVEERLEDGTSRPTGASIKITKTLPPKERQKAKRAHRKQRASLVQPVYLKDESSKWSRRVREKMRLVLKVAGSRKWFLELWAEQETERDNHEDAENAGYWSCNKVVERTARIGGMARVPTEDQRIWSGPYWESFVTGWKKRLREEQDKKKAEKWVTDCLK